WRGDRGQPIALLLAMREIAQGLFNAAFDLPEITDRELSPHQTLPGLSQRKWLKESSRSQVRRSRYARSLSPIFTILVRGQSPVPSSKYKAFAPKAALTTVPNRPQTAGSVGYSANATTGDSTGISRWMKSRRTKLARAQR